MITGTVVPTGERLRVTRLLGEVQGQGSNLTVYLSLNNDVTPIFMFPSNVFTQGFFGNGVSFNQDVDFYFEAGQTPYLVVANPAGSGGISNSTYTRLSIVGYIVNTTP